MASKVEAKPIEYTKIQEKQVFTEEFFHVFKYLSSIHYMTVIVLGAWVTSVAMKMDKNLYYFGDYFLLGKRDNKTIYTINLKIIL